MNKKIIQPVRIFLLLILFNSVVLDSIGQLHIGPKAGIQTFIPIYKDAVKGEEISARPKIGLNLGFGLDYNINDKVSFYTEFLYSLKGKSLSGGIRDQFKHKATYHYLELPVMARLTFHENIKGKMFAWYLNGGGTFNYWLAGNGSIKSFEYHESAVDQLDYKIKFKSEPENTFYEEFAIYLSEPNRIQVGLVFGGGILLDIARRRLMMIDLRYTLRHSWLARDYEIDVGLDEYYEDFRTMEHILSLSVAYLFEYNIGDRLKGKSTKGEKVKTKKGNGPPTPKKNNINKIKK